MPPLFFRNQPNWERDLIIHSATKWIDGQGRVLGGAVLGSDEKIRPIFDFLRRTGACLSPFNAWILSKSLETLALRMERHSSNALAVASALEQHSRVASVRYPWLPSHPQHQLAQEQMTMGGGIVTVDLNGGQKECFKMINALKMLSITANLGDARTIITHPATTTHSKLDSDDQIRAGILPSTMRLSIGLEHFEDILSDLLQALDTLS